MSQSTKLLWGEGLFLRPQHFQRQDAYHEARLMDMASALHPYAWGVRKAQFDTASLANGVLRALELSLVFPDGESYLAPEQDELPEAVALDALPAGQQRPIFYAALPLNREFGANFSGKDSSGAPTRFVQVNRKTPDLFTDAAEAEIAFLKKALRLLSDTQPRDQFVAIPVVRLRRTSTGSFELDQNFVAPSLSIRAAPALHLQLRRLLDALQAKVAALYGHHGEPSKNMVEYRPADMSSFWLLNTASAGFGGLSHLFNQPGFHPERLFQKLLELTGALMAFSRQYQLADLPTYQHEDPGPGFTKLDGMIRELLDTVISARYFAIPLSETKPSYHSGRLDSQKIDDKTAFYLSVSADLPPAELIDVVPLRFKIGSPDDVEKLVLSAMPGIKLSHAAQVPSAIPVRPGAYYFSVDARGAIYERMLKAQSTSIYVPSGLRDLKLELLAVTS